MQEVGECARDADVLQCKLRCVLSVVMIHWLRPLLQCAVLGVVMVAVQLSLMWVSMTEVVMQSHGRLLLAFTPPRPGLLPHHARMRN